MENKERTKKREKLITNRGKEIKNREDRPRNMCGSVAGIPQELLLGKLLSTKSRVFGEDLAGSSLRIRAIYQETKDQSKKRVTLGKHALSDLPLGGQ